MSPRKEPRLRRPRKFSQTIYITLAIAIVCIVLISVVLSMFNTFWLTRDRSISDAAAIIRLVSENLNRIAAEISRTVSRIAEDERIIGYLINGYEQEIKQILSPSTAVVEDMRCVVLFSSDNVCRYITDGYALEPSAAAEIIDAAGKAVVIRRLGGVSSTSDPEGSPKLVAYKAIHTSSGARCGTIAVFWDDIAFRKDIRYADMFDEGSIFALSESGAILYPANTYSVHDLTGREPDDLLRDIQAYQMGKNIGVGRLLFSQEIPNMVNIFGVMETEVILKSVTNSILGYAVTALLISIIMLALANMLIKSTTRPLAYLLQSVSDFRHGNTKVRFPSSSIQEIDLLSSELNRMTGTIDQLLEDNNKKQKSLYEKERQILWAQFNPHLLYNSMNTIVETAQQGAIQKVVDITIALAKYFQITLSHGEDLIPIRDEICHAKNYLIIQKIRFEDLDYKLEVEETILNYRIPKLILQPIIENSIYHGIKGFARNGMISLRAYMNTGYITFEIEDNGRGMRREELDGVLNGHNQQNITTGIGLSNISQRLQLYFGKEGSVIIESTFRKGTRVIIRFPPKSI